MASLSSHVLDTSRGKPAAGVVVELHAVRGGERRHVRTASTGADGRIARENLEPGVYELLFRAGDYFRAGGLALPQPPFLDEVVIRFGVSEPEGHYHVPLLLSPYGYSIYRGS